MRVFRSLTEVPADFGPSVVTIGNFDGMHVGHRQIMRRVVGLAREKRCLPAVLTFDPHPARVLAPERAPKLLMTIDQRLRAMEEEGIEAVVLIPFSMEFAALTPEEFARRTLAETIRAKVVLVGSDFRFGCKQSGNIETLREMGGQFGFEVEPIDGIARKGVRISSTAVRELIARGEVSKACRLLDGPFELEGHVVKGQGIGSKQTVPTLNLAAENEVLPATGVYVTRTYDLGSGSAWASITNVGYRPTFDGRELTIETFLLTAMEPSHLSAREQTIERETYARAQAQQSEYIRQYRERFGDCFSSDKAAELFPEYAASEESRTLNRAAVTKASHFVADNALLERLRVDDRKAVSFVVGGPGAGKTTSSVAAISRGDIVFDGSAVHAERLIDEAVVLGRDIAVEYIHRDPVDAFRGTLDRAMTSPTERGRVIPLLLHEHLHHGSAEAIQRISGKYRARWGVTLRFVINRAGEDPRVGSVEDVARTSYIGLKEQLRHVLDAERAANRITVAVYDRVLKGPGAGAARRRDSAGDHQNPDGQVRRIPGQPEKLEPGPISRIAVRFLSFIRSERRFESPEALKSQILKDVGVANRLHRRLAKYRVG